VAVGKKSDRLPVGPCSILAPENAAFGVQNKTRIGLRFLPDLPASKKSGSQAATVSQHGRFIALLNNVLVLAS
jgi:hypothetical protein